MNKYLKIFLTTVFFGGLSFSNPNNVDYSKIAILYSGLSEKFNDANSTKIIDTITAWELFLMQQKISYKVIYDEDIESGINDDFDILILPSVNFISNDELVELKNFLADGNSIICSGSKLLFANQPRDDFQNLETLFGLNNIEPVASDLLSFQHSIIPNYLNQFSLDDDLVMQISNRNNALQSDNYEIISYPYGYILEKNESDINSSSILFGSTGTGKFLWTGFDLTDIIGGEDDLLLFKKLITNSISWMDKNPDVYIQNFNDDLSFPVVFGIQNNNALDEKLIDALKINNAKPGLFVTPEQSIKNELLERFKEDEIVLDLSDYTDLKPNKLAELINNFNTENKIRLSSILVSNELLNKNDLYIFKENGIDKILFTSQVFGLPQLNKNNILLIPFTKIDNHFSEETINCLYYNPRISCEKDLEDELLIEVNKLKFNKCNFISLNSLKEYWKIKEQISAEVKSFSKENIEIIINNRSSVKIGGLKVFVNNNKSINKKSFTVTCNNSILKYKFDDAAEVFEIPLKNIQANSKNTIKINFNIE